MDDPSPPAALLNIYEVVGDDGVHRHYVCFLEPDRANAEGIDPRTVIGEFTPGPGHSFDPDSFALNPGFVEAFTGYMNENAGRSVEVEREALKEAGGWLYILDPRFQPGDGKEPGPVDLLGGFVVDGSGRVVPDSFVYNDNHRWFTPDSGVSGVLSDRAFYDWLHATPGATGSP